jgi:hypothetical protein
METTSCQIAAHQSPAWPNARLLLDALTRRDFDAMQELLDDGVRFRALVPGGPFELDTADATAARFRSWFGGEDEFEVLDTSIGEVASRLYARWRVRMCPPGRPEESRVAEQHVFATGTKRITSLDLLCSGFHRSIR